MAKQEITLNILDAACEAYGNMVRTLESPPRVIVDQIADDSIIDRKPEQSDKIADYQTARLLHAAMGCVTESGELMDQLKKHIVYNRPLDVVNFQEELGDILWYIQLACNVLGVSFTQLMIQNAKKLQVRFGDKFDFDKVINRDLDAERKSLEENSTPNT